MGPEFTDRACHFAQGYGVYRKGNMMHEDPLAVGYKDSWTMHVAC